MKELVIPIKGMHCRSCEITLGERLSELPDVKTAEANLKSKTATIHATHLPPQSVIRSTIQACGYDIGYDKKPWFSHHFSDYENILYGVLVIIAFAVILKTFHLTDFSALNTTGKAGGMVALIVGLTAGFSTCMALVGGLVLGLSARHAEKHPSATTGQKFRPHLVFNASRILAFIILGGVIGAVGSLFSLNGSLLGVLTIGVGIVMLLLGLQLTELFPRLSNGGLTLPPRLLKVLGIRKRGDKEYSHRNAATLGVLSFFLPCGFTQAMQLYAISTGSPLKGAVIMGLFALGTAPGLLSIGGLTAIVKGSFAKRFFKVAGVAVVAMALYNIRSGYTLTGWPIPFAGPNQIASIESPRYSPSPLTKDADQQPTQVSSDVAANHILRATFWVKSEMFPKDFTVNVNEAYTLEVEAKEDGVGCMSTIMIPGLNNKPQYLKGGETNKLAFKAKRPGVYKITCAMGVERGTITVI